VREIVLAATRALVGVAARSVAELGEEISLAQYRVLVLLDGLGAQTMSALADSLGVYPSTVTRVCDRLVAKKLIVRRPSEEDRRAVRVELTPRGRRLVAQAMERRLRLIDEILERMRPEDAHQLARALTYFTAAAGEISDEAWALGWPINDDREPLSTRSSR